MKFLVLIVATYTIFVLHTAFARDLSISGCAPHFVLAGLIVIASRLNGPPRLILASCCGLLADCLAAGRLGPETAAYALIVLALDQAEKRWNLRQPVARASLAFPLICGALLGSQVLRAWHSGRPVDFGAPAIQSAGSAVYTALIAAALLFLLRFVWPASYEEAVQSAPTVSNRWRMLTE